MALTMRALEPAHRLRIVFTTVPREPPEILDKRADNDDVLEAGRATR
jgi:hypothetical protein